LRRASTAGNEVGEMRHGRRGPGRPAAHEEIHCSSWLCLLTIDYERGRRMQQGRNDPCSLRYGARPASRSLQSAARARPPAVKIGPSEVPAGFEHRSGTSAPSAASARVSLAQSGRAWPLRTKRDRPVHGRALSFSGRGGGFAAAAPGKRSTFRVPRLRLGFAGPPPARSRLHRRSLRSRLRTGRRASSLRSPPATNAFDAEGNPRRLAARLPRASVAGGAGRGPHPGEPASAGARDGRRPTRTQ